VIEPCACALGFLLTQSPSSGLPIICATTPPILSQLVDAFFFRSLQSRFCRLVDFSLFALFSEVHTNFWPLFVTIMTPFFSRLEKWPPGLATIPPPTFVFRIFGATSVFFFYPSLWYQNILCFSIDSRSLPFPICFTSPRLAIFSTFETNIDFCPTFLCCRLFFVPPTILPLWVFGMPPPDFSVITPVLSFAVGRSTPP